MLHTQVQMNKIQITTEAVRESKLSTNFWILNYYRNK